ncbi:MAG: glycosyltransferase, partial [Deinococcus sp.]|nr:glycosyltransferase [Deinococcus sp.]
MERRLIWLLLVAIALRLVLWASSTELYPDEAYYWDGTRHLALSYSDHPPLLVYLAYVTTALFGQSELAVRLGP